MGVRQHNLILIGYDIGSEYYDDAEWEKEDCLYEKYHLSKNSEAGDNVILIDGYSGKYFIVGKLIQVDYEAVTGFYQFVPDMESKDYKEAKQEVKDLIKDLYAIDVEPTYIVMTHFT